MFIAQNPIERSVFVVVTFWYTTLFVLSGFHGVPVWHVVYLFPVSLLITAAGGAVSIAWVIATYRKSRGITGQELKAGSRVRQASFSLGAPPRIPAPEHVRRDDRALLDRLPWWNPIRQRAPRYAEAIRAVLRIMNTCPRFPASPVPGGHGGHTLIEHSVAVASQMLREAGTWRYKGQLDKQGNLRVPLQSGHVHRFQPTDGPLLVLTGLAHDIGKLACWEVIPDEAEQQRRQAGKHPLWGRVRRVWGRLRGTPSGPGGKEPPLRVNEIRRMHDVEGARMLRRVPEIMALPLADRTALLTAIQYYHHPMAMPIAPWVTDKVRSLTELLIKADIETGKQEGHVLTDNDPDREYGREDAPASGNSAQTTVSDAGTSTEIALETVLAVGREQQRHEMQQGDYEFRLLDIALNKPDAVNGKYGNQRIAWKRGDWIYVMDPLARQNIRNMKEIKDPIWAVDAFDDNHGNASPFTKAVLQQLDARGALLTEFDGKRYPATRALFNMRLKEKGGVIPVFVIKASLFPELYAPEAPKDTVLKLIGPLWGEHTAKRGAEDTGSSTRETAGQAGEQQEQPNAEPTPKSPPSAETRQTINEPAPSDAAAFEDASGMDDADLPFDPGPLNDAPDTAEGEPSDAQQDAPPESEQQTLDDAGTVVDTGAALVNTVLESDWPLIRRDRNGTSWVLVDVNSEGGAWIEQEIKRMKASAHTLRFTPVRQVDLSDLKIRAWAFEVPKTRDELA